MGIYCHWDTQGDTVGWYCEVTENGMTVDDSMKAWFPVNVDDFTADQADALEKALVENFPGHEITIRQ
ncbi:hypothetical protein HNR65_003427 [Desulfosalsimonas propionicica]|uniref:Uncharacterized protein n=1 Tax=Desulfosalsimonas propionicica TaxID=332175 RepID=A0A7W0HM71_9BACT|nr:hypothetical protein [Desulfosalsimonas propionicica]MBA2883070.1 hypothetical protein [Desulfosalsimonas propionicica]